MGGNFLLCKIRVFFKSFKFMLLFKLIKDTKYIKLPFLYLIKICHPKFVTKMTTTEMFT